MAFWDFLKKIKGSGEKEVVSPSQTKENQIKASEIESFVKNKKEEIDVKNEKLLSAIRERLRQTITELQNEQMDIKNVDLGKHKVEIKIKAIVKQNLDNYAEYLGRLIDGLKSLDDVGLDRIVARINFLFYDFEKKSAITFQKATFLIGKELEAVRLTNRSFFKDLKAMLDLNSELGERTRVVYGLNDKVESLKEQDKIIDDIKKKIKEKETSVYESENYVFEREKEMKEIEGTGEQRRIEEIKSNLNSSNEKLKQSISGLGSTINFKAIASVFHTNKKKMDIINEHKNKFESAFLEDNGKRILSLINESGLSHERIDEKLKEVQEHEKAFEYWKNELGKTGKDTLRELEKEIETAKSWIKKTDLEIEGEKKKIEKFELSKKEILDSIKAELLKLKVEIVD